MLVGAGVGVGMAATSSHPTPAASGPTTTAAAGGKHASKHTGNTATSKTGAATPGATKTGATKPAAKAVDPARAAWSHQYGQDRSTMPNLSPADSGTAQQQGAATDLLTRTEAATAPYADLAKAKASGYDLQASLAKKQKKSPRVAEQIKRIDAGTAPTDAKMPMLHVGNTTLKADGKILDPNAAESLMYTYQGAGSWKLIGVMYIATESYPQAPPDPGGPITRWHYHDKSGAKGLMMHLFFVPGNDLAHAYATEMG